MSFPENQKITHYTVLGERCSGTNFLNAAIKNNFKLNHNYICHKHFYGFADFTKPEYDNTLFIAIVREPYEFMNSLKKMAHHLPNYLKKDINSFLNKEVYSNHVDDNNIEDLNDRHIHTKEKYKNMFELRKVKLDYLLNYIPKMVKNYIFIRYETLRDYYNETLQLICDTFDLQKRHRNFVPIKSYKGENYFFYQPNTTLYIMKPEKVYEHPDFDKNFEKKLGYFLEDEIKEPQPIIVQKHNNEQPNLQNRDVQELFKKFENLINKVIKEDNTEE